MAISPAYASLYDYTIQEDQEDHLAIYIFVRHPEDFDASDLRICDSSESDGLWISLPDPHPPLIKCQLFKPIESVTPFRYSSTQYRFRITKAREELWGSFVRGFYPGTEDLDPKSAFTLAQSDIPEASAYLELAVTFRFAPALLHFYRTSQDQPGLHDIAMTNLRIAAETYVHPESQYELAKVLETENNLAGALVLLRTAFNHGFVLAGVEIGLLCSPASDQFPKAKKDAQFAFQILEQVIKTSENPIALYELANLHFNGLGTPQNPAVADRLLVRARKVDPAIPNKCRVVEVGNIWPYVLIGGGVVVAGVLGWLALRRRK
jgi:hypothetical protein